MGVKTGNKIWEENMGVKFFSKIWEQNLWEIFFSKVGSKTCEEIWEEILETNWGENFGDWNWERIY